MTPAPPAEIDNAYPQARRVARGAENAGFTLVTIEDDPARVGAVERAAFVAMSTSVLGVAPVISTTYAEPFRVSSQLATLDHLTAGRAGWVVGTSPSAEAARARGHLGLRDPLTQRAERAAS